MRQSLRRSTFVVTLALALPLAALPVAAQTQTQKPATRPSTAKPSTAKPSTPEGAKAPAPPPPQDVRFKSLYTNGDMKTDGKPIVSTMEVTEFDANEAK